MKRAALLLALTGGSALAALGPRYGGDATVGLVAFPPSVELAVVPRTPGERLLAGLVHETLVGVSLEGVPAPAVARRWSVGASGREWTLEIHDGLVFHDERPVTAADAARSVRRFLRSDSPAAARLAESLEGGPAYRTGVAPDLGGVATSEPGKLVLRLAAESALPLAPLAAPAARVTSSTGAGCGPFVPTVTTPGRVGLTAFGAHLRGRPFLDRVQLVALPGPEALRADLASGRVDLAVGEPGPEALASTLLLVFDGSRAPFDAREAREAVSAAVDRADLVRHFIPRGEATRSLLVPALLPPLGPELRPSAVTLHGRVSLLVAKDVPPRVSQRVVAYLSAAGLDVAVRAVSAGQVLEGGAHLKLLLWTPEVAEAGLALAELAALAPSGSSVARALAAAEAERDLDRRRARLLEAEAALREGLLLSPLASVPVTAAPRPGLHGVKVDLGGRVLLEDAWVEP